MLYKGHLRRQIKEVGKLLGEIIAHDDKQSALTAADGQQRIVVTADATDRQAFETFLERCQGALKL